jgi:hypothetical protein
MPGGQAGPVCCDRCAALADSGQMTVSPVAQLLATRIATGLAGGPHGSWLTPDVNPSPPASTALSGASAAKVARRRLLRSAVFPAQNASAAASEPSGFANAAQLPRTVSGTILDISPHVLVLGEAGCEQRFTLTADAVVWRGSQLGPTGLHYGDHAFVRLHASSRHVADRIWANIGRVTGIIVERSGNSMLVYEGATRRPQVVTIRPQAVGRIQVRFPTLEPGFMVDIIGLRRDGELEGLIPATSQPAYPAHRLPPPPLTSGHVPTSISGSATWHEPGDEPPGVLGVNYPALDPDAGCAENTALGARHSYFRMPYLAIGSVLRVRNDCTSQQCLVPVTGCAAIARLFNDRCVTCGTSPRGRIADLTLASFIALGGELERGCFNATITIGE